MKFYIQVPSVPWAVDNYVDSCLITSLRGDFMTYFNGTRS